MSRYLLLMRGDQSGFNSMTAEEQKKIIGDHIQFSQELEKKKLILDGDGCSSSTILLEKKGKCVKTRSNPYAATENQLSGFYVIEAKDDEDAVRIAKGCPALKHGESVEVVKLGH